MAHASSLTNWHYRKVHEYKMQMKRILGCSMSNNKNKSVGQEITFMICEALRSVRLFCKASVDISVCVGGCGCVGVCVYAWTRLFVWTLCLNMLKMFLVDNETTRIYFNYVILSDL